MKINDMDFIQLMPAFMKEDEAVQGLSEGVNRVTEELADKIKLFSTWNQIDNMTDAELDMLAEELHISWYDKAAAIEVKRGLIKNSDMVHSKMGTNWAVQNVIETYFGSGEIEDWFDYEGEPHHFRVITENQSITAGASAKFLSVLEKVKRKSAFLDGIEVVADGECNIHVFLLSCERETITSNVIFPNSHKNLSGYTHKQLSAKTHKELGGMK